MKIGVLVKTVKFIYAQTGTELRNNYVGPADIVHMLNPLDEAALEYALQLKEQHPGTTVVAMACGDDTAEVGLRRGLAMGVDQAVHIQCEGSGELDAVATSLLQSLACQRFGFDLVLCGANAIDVNERLEAPYLAERLGIAHATNVVSIQAQKNRPFLDVERVVERGDRQQMTCRMPVLLTVEKGALTPRYPTLGGFLRARDSQLDVLTLSDFGFAVQDSITAMSVTEVTGYTRPKPKRKTGAAQQPLKSVAERIKFMVNGDSSAETTGGKLVDAGSAEMFARLDEILGDAGILPD